MVRQEEHYKSFQIFRPVSETLELARFLKAADIAGHMVLAATDSITLPRAENTGASDFDDEPGIVDLQAYGIARHDIYERNKIKLTLFDRRSPTSSSSPLIRLYERFTPTDESTRTRFSRANKPAPSAQKQRVEEWRLELRRAALRHDIPDPDQLRVTFNDIRIVPNPGYEQKGWEYSLMPDDTTPEGLLLIEEANISHKTVAELNKHIAYPTSRPIIEASVARLPSDTPDDILRDFHQRLGALLPIELILGSVSTDI